MSRFERGQASVIGVVILLAIVLTGMTLTVALGSTAITETKSQLGNERAAKTLTKVDSQAAMVALAGTETRRVQLGANDGGDYTLRRGDSWINITLENTTSNNKTTLLNESLGTVTYETDDETVAYQGGGVWRQPDGTDQSLMISPPEFHFRNGTLTLPIITMSAPGDGRLGSDVTLERNGSSVDKFPNSTANGNWTNPLENYRVEITIHTEYYQAWGGYFEQRTDGGVEYDHEDKLVNLTLLRHGGKKKVKRGLMLYGDGENEIQVQGGGNPPTTITGYNSSELSPSRTAEPGEDEAGTVVTNADIKFSGKAEVNGTLVTDGKVTQWGSGSGHRIKGRLDYGEGSVDSDDCDDRVKTQVCTKNASVGTQDPVANEIKNTIDEIESDHNTTSNECIGVQNGLKFENATAGCGTTITLEAGDYYTTQSAQIDDSSYKLKLDTTEGDIRIAIDDGNSFKVGSGAEVKVIGDGRVEVYNTDDVTIDGGGGTKVWNEGWDAPQMWIYGDAETDVTIKAVYNGVVYAPSNASHDGDVTIQGGDTKVYGGVVGDTDADIKGQSEVYFDRALRDENVFGQPTVPDVSYLHVSVNRINVTD